MGCGFTEGVAMLLDAYGKQESVISSFNDLHTAGCVGSTEMVKKLLLARFLVSIMIILPYIPFI